MQQRDAKMNCEEISGETGSEGKEVSSRHIFLWLLGHRYMVEAHLQFCYCAEGPEVRKIQHQKNITQTSGDTEDVCVYPQQDQC